MSDKWKDPLKPGDLFDTAARKKRKPLPVCLELFVTGPDHENGAPGLRVYLMDKKGYVQDTPLYCTLTCEGEGFDVDPGLVMHVLKIRRGPMEVSDE